MKIRLAVLVIAFGIALTHASEPNREILASWDAMEKNLAKHGKITLQHVSGEKLDNIILETTISLEFVDTFSSLEPRTRLKSNLLTYVKKGNSLTFRDKDNKKKTQPDDAP